MPCQDGKEFPHCHHMDSRSCCGQRRPGGGPRGCGRSMEGGKPPPSYPWSLYSARSSQLAYTATQPHCLFLSHLEEKGKQAQARAMADQGLGGGCLRAELGYEPQLRRVHGACTTAQHCRETCRMLWQAIRSDTRTYVIVSAPISAWPTDRRLHAKAG